MLLRRLWLVLVITAVVPALFPALASPPGPAPNPTPTADRLAAPPTVTDPTQADQGAQLFWLHCQPCHGDQAQGLTDDWRAQYPPEDQDCWKSGCHGNRPYQNGFTLPRTIPALIGPSTLSRFGTAADLYAFISHAMPFQAPGSLKPEEYWAITAFLMRGHGLPAASLPITDAAAAQRLPLGATAVATAPAVAAATPGSAAGRVATMVLVPVAALVATGAAWWWLRRARGHG